jgi:hypothetical protein
VSIEISEDFASGSYLVTAEVPGTDPGSVTFVLREAGATTWRVLGTDDARPFRVYLDPDRLGRGKKVEVAAIVTDSMGQRSTSKTAALTLTPLF